VRPDLEEPAFRARGSDAHARARLERADGRGAGPAPRPCAAGALARRRTLHAGPRLVGGLLQVAAFLRRTTQLEQDLLDLRARIHEQLARILARPRPVAGLRLLQLALAGVQLLLEARRAGAGSVELVDEARRLPLVRLEACERLLHARLVVVAVALGPVQHRLRQAQPARDRQTVAPARPALHQAGRGLHPLRVALERRVDDPAPRPVEALERPERRRRARAGARAP